MTVYETWSVAIQCLILVAGVLTVFVYYRQLKAMENQLKALLETSNQSSHLDLLKLAISDEDVRKVWQAELPTLDSIQFKQHVFVNLHLAHLATLFELGRLKREHLEASLKVHFANSYYRDFWENGRWFRDNTEKQRIFRVLCENAYSTAAAQPSAAADRPQAAGR